MNHKKHHKPLVAIVGSPNVGKSTLFNRLIEQRKAIVEDIPGVTRDRIYGEVNWKGRCFSVVDTGGLVISPDDNNEKLIKEQVQIAIDSADLILFVMDGKSGLMPEDVEILNCLRKSKTSIINVVNKTDHSKQELKTYEFYRLGMEEFIPISALHNRNTYELTEKIVENIPESRSERVEEDESIINISVIGKPNVGKSTLVNSIIGEERFITSPVPGTTRDSVDTSFVFNGKNYLIVDTAGIRRRSRISELLEKHSVFRAVRAISRSDIVLFLVDAADGPTHHDSRLGNLIEGRGAASIILLNKWDLAPEEAKNVKDIDTITKERLISLGHSPVLKLSALTGKGIPRLFKTINKVYENYDRKIKTGELNRFLDGIKNKYPPKIYKGSQLKLYYMSQLQSRPPTFVLFTNARKEIPDNYRKFIENQLRISFDFEGSPVRLIVRTRQDEKKEGERKKLTRR